MVQNYWTFQTVQFLPFFLFLNFRRPSTSIWTAQFNGWSATLKNCPFYSWPMSHGRPLWPWSGFDRPFLIRNFLRPSTFSRGLPISTVEHEPQRTIHFDSGPTLDLTRSNEPILWWNFVIWIKFTLRFFIFLNFNRDRFQFFLFHKMKQCSLFCRVFSRLH